MDSDDEPLVPAGPPPEKRRMYEDSESEDLEDMSRPEPKRRRVMESDSDSDDEDLVPRPMIARSEASDYMPTHDESEAGVDAEVREEERRVQEERRRRIDESKTVQDLDMSDESLYIATACGIRSQGVDDQMNAQRIEALVGALDHLWCAPSHSFEESMKRFRCLLMYRSTYQRVFPGDETPECNSTLHTPEDILGVYKQWRNFTNDLLYLSMRGENVEFLNNDELRDTTDAINRIEVQMKHAFESVQNQAIFQLGTQSSAVPSASSAGLEHIFTDEDVDDMNEAMYCFMHYAMEMRKRRLWRKEEYLYEPVYTVYNGQVTYTKFAKQKYTIQEFIWDVMSPLTDNKALVKMMTTRNTMRLVENYLMLSRDNSVRDLSINRDWVSFKNGVYDLKDCKFYPFVSTGPTDKTVKFLDKVHPDNVHKTSVTYIDMVFDDEVYSDLSRPTEEEIADDPDAKHDWSRIETPHIDKIADSQKWPVEVRDWFYIMLGRLFYEVGTDNWQVMLFNWGIGNTGKSTVFLFMTAIWPFSEVGIMANEGRDNFQLEGIYDKLVYFCYDMNEKMKLKSTHFLSMVAGDAMTVDRIYKTNVPLKRWTTPGAWSGNGPPSFDNSGDQVARRFMIFLFMEILKNIDTTLFAKMHTEMPAFVAKATKMYQDARTRIGEKGIWDKGILPQYFHSNRNRLTTKTNTLAGFLHQGRIRIGEGNSCSVAEFNEAFYEWATREGVDQAARRMNQQARETTFNKYKIQKIDPRGKPGDHPYAEPYYTNIRLLEEDEQYVPIFQYLQKKNDDPKEVAEQVRKDRPEDPRNIRRAEEAAREAADRLPVVVEDEDEDEDQPDLDGRQRARKRAEMLREQLDEEEDDNPRPQKRYKRSDADPGDVFA